MKIVYVLAGGTLGAVARYGICLWSERNIGTGFPFGTLIVNLAGCLLIGLLFGLAETKGLSPSFKVFFITGFLGALTTFSAYAFESVSSEDFKIFAANVLANNVGGLLLVWLGLELAKIWQVRAGTYLGQKLWELERPLGLYRGSIGQILV